MNFKVSQVPLGMSVRAFLGRSSCGGALPMVWSSRMNEKEKASKVSIHLSCTS